MSKQTYDNLEIIVINDGSTDSTAEIISQYPFVIIHNQQNVGLSASRNIGIEKATGEFIHFMDGDDFINLDFYRNMVDAILETNVETACSGLVSEGRNDRTLFYKKRKVYYNNNDKMKYTLAPKWGYVWRYLFSIDLIKKHNLKFEVGRFIEDMPFTIQALFYSKGVVVVPGAEYYYSLTPNSIMRNKDKNHIAKRKEDAKHTVELVKEFAKQNGFKLYGATSGKISYALNKFMRILFEKRVEFPKRNT